MYAFTASSAEPLTPPRRVIPAPARAFFFMPVLIAMSASKKFGTNMYYAASIALIMLHPNFISLMSNANNAGETIKFLKFIPVTYANYSYSVIPIILAKVP